MDITIVGLGPGPLALITLEAMRQIETAEVLLLRTARHPAVSELQAKNFCFESYDCLYDALPTFDQVYKAIAEDVISRACLNRVVYAVPGSPQVAEKTVPMIKQGAAARGLSVTVLPAMSFLDVLYTRLGIDPQDGLTIIDSSEVGQLLDVSSSLVVSQLYNRQVASEVKLALMELLPDEHQIFLCLRLGLESEAIREIPLYELDRQADIDHLTTLYVPAYKRAKTFSLDPLIDVMARLRSPGGCVWDIEQTHKSLRRYIVEEVYEVLEAIDEADGDKLCEELGDLLLQIVFHARMAEETGVFSMQDVVHTVTEKMVRRHPHVFGEITVRDAAEVVVNWDKIKQIEKSAERVTVLAGVPKGLPSLMRAYKLQAKAAKVGFDWEDPEPVWGKIQEELVELREALNGKDLHLAEGELGDVLFAVVNLARKYSIDAEIALNLTNEKFARRFGYIEADFKRRGIKWQDCRLEDLDKLWDEAKKTEVE